MPSPDANITTSMQVRYNRIRSSTSCLADIINASAGTTVQSQLIRTTVSSRTPDYFDRKRKGLPLPFHNYSFRVFTLVDNPGLFKQTQISTPCFYEYTYFNANVGFLLGAQTIDVADDPTSKVNSKLLQKISLGKADLGVTVAEMGKTASFVRETATRLAASIKALRRLDIVHFTRALGVTPNHKQVQRFKRNRIYYGTDDMRHSQADRRTAIEAFAAKTWLEYTYAWKPMLSDVYALAEASASLMVDWDYLARTVVATAKTSKEVNKTETVVNNFVRQVSSQSAWDIKASISYRIKDGDKVTNANNVFGLSNPLTIAWELVPFSFVADWFLPIGTAIANLSATAGLEFVGGYYTNKVSTWQTVKVTSKGSYTSGGFSWKDVSCNLSQIQTERKFSRSGMVSFPSPPFPEFKNPISFSHALSSIALLSSLFRK